MVSRRARDLRRHLRARRREMVAFLQRLALAETPSAERERQLSVLDALSEELAGIGYATRRLRGGCLYARPIDRGGPVQLLLGHCDTVWPVGTVKHMRVKNEGDIVRGPGVYDMKAGLAQMVFALSAIHALEFEPAVRPVVFVNSDEEIGSRASSRHIRRLCRVSERAFILEPSLGPSGKLKTARKGVGRFSVIVEGRASHAGLDPQGGASAILELSYVIQELFALNDPASGVTVNVGRVDGGLGPNVVAPRCSAQVEVRVPTAEDARRVEKRVLSLQPSTKGVQLKIEGGMGRPPMERTPRNRKLWETARELGGQLDLDLEEGLAGGASDGNTASLYTATLDGLGAVGDGAHARHEFVHVDSMIERAALLALLVLQPPLDERSES